MELIYNFLEKKDDYDRCLHECLHEMDSQQQDDSSNDQQPYEHQNNPSSNAVATLDEKKSTDKEKSVELRCRYNPKYLIDTNLYYEAIFDELWFWSFFKLYLFWYNSLNNDGDNSDIEWVACTSLMLTMAGSLYCLVRCCIYFINRTIVEDTKKEKAQEARVKSTDMNRVFRNNFWFWSIPLNPFDFGCSISSDTDDDIGRGLCLLERGVKLSQINSSDSLTQNFICDQWPEVSFPIATSSELPPPVALENFRSSENKDEAYIDNKFINLCVKHFSKWDKYLNEVSDTRFPTTQRYSFGIESHRSSSTSRKMIQCDNSEKDIEDIKTFFFYCRMFAGAHVLDFDDQKEIKLRQITQKEIDLSGILQETCEKSMLMVFKSLIYTDHEIGSYDDDFKKMNNFKFLIASAQDIFADVYDDYSNHDDPDEDDFINDHTDFRVYNCMYRRLVFEWNRFICYICSMQPEVAQKLRDLKGHIKALLHFMIIEDSERIIPLSEDDRKNIKKTKDEDWSVDASIGFEGVAFYMELVEKTLSELWKTYGEEDKKRRKYRKSLSNKHLSLHEDYNHGQFSSVAFSIYRDLFLRNAVYNKMRRNIKELTQCFANDLFFENLRTEMKLRAENATKKADKEAYENRCVKCLCLPWGEAKVEIKQPHIFLYSLNK